MEYLGALIGALSVPVVVWAVLGLVEWPAPWGAVAALVTALVWIFLAPWAWERAFGADEASQGQP